MSAEVYVDQHGSHAGPKMIPERDTYAPSDYMQEPHRDMSQPVYEIVDGERRPFILYRTGPANEEIEVHVTVGMIPLEHRQFIAADGTIVPQHEFEQKLQRWRRGHFLLAEAPVPELQIDPVPQARRLLSLGVSRHDPSKLVAIGHEKRAEHSERDDSPIVDVQGLGAGWAKAPEKKDEPAPAAPADDEVARLRAEVERLRAAAEAPARSKPARKTITAPCGKELKGGLHFHKRKCSECQALEPGPEAA